MNNLPFEYQIVTKTYLKPTYLPTYATVMTVVTFVTVVTVVTVVTKKVLNQHFFSLKSFFSRKFFFFHQQLFSPNKSNCEKNQNMTQLKTQNVTKLKMQQKLKI